tara:strand:- start:5170 stop:5367 length:198 start_codon:yes stop_codon:yes gene_type:complete
VALAAPNDRNVAEISPEDSDLDIAEREPAVAITSHSRNLDQAAFGMTNGGHSYGGKLFFSIPFPK